MFEGIYFQGAPDYLTSGQLRRDISDVVKSHSGSIILSTNLGRHWMEIYEISEKGVVMVHTDDLMKIHVNTINCDGALPKGDINALISLIGFEQNEYFNKLHDDLCSIRLKYKIL